jgi:hypothetical protein
MLNRIFSLAGSWKTSLLGALGFVCSTSELLGALPDEYQARAMAACLMLTSLGLIAAKDANKTHSPKPTTTPQTLSVTTGEVKE